MKNCNIHCQIKQKPINVSYFYNNFCVTAALYYRFFPRTANKHSSNNNNTVCLQMNGAVSKVNKKFISNLTRAQRTPLAAATLQVSHALPAVRSLVHTAGLRGQFPRWRRSRKRLSVCSVLRCPYL